jgi:hypothetical protein
MDGLHVVKGNLRSVFTILRSVEGNLRAGFNKLRDFEAGCRAATVCCAFSGANFEIPRCARDDKGSKCSGTDRGFSACKKRGLPAIVARSVR